VFWKVRFVPGDFNMACYRIVPELNRQGIEACLLDFRVEWPSDATSNKLLHYTGGIIAVGGLTH
jgi:hypothetical protein